VRSVGFNRQVLGKEGVRAIGDGHRFREFSCEEGVPCQTVERLRRLTSSIFRQRLLLLQRFRIDSSPDCLTDWQFL
jgi:hypothetical protein